MTQIYNYYLVGGKFSKKQTKKKQKQEEPLGVEKMVWILTIHTKSHQVSLEVRTQQRGK